MPTLLITGANRGLGLEFTRQYAAAGWQVFACCRTAADLPGLAALSAFGKVSAHVLDVTDFGAVDRLAAELRGTALDVLLNNAGTFGPNPFSGDNPAQVFGHIDYAVWGEVLRINTMAPLKLAEAFVEHVAASSERKIVTVSSTEGSITQTRGNLYAYKTSKAAVNMVMRNLAADLKPRGIIAASLCPGWAKTRMGGVHAIVEVPDSIAGMRRIIASLTPEQTGMFLRYNGETVPW
jgi:NAD(P)-dependent dehydrogenase (short-subunit alcohol dehydrogenase family)